MTRARIIMHAAIVMLIGIACGLPAVTQVGAGVEELWRAAHMALMMTSIFMLATSSTLTAIVLDERDESALVWSMLGFGYGFVVGVITGAVQGRRVFEPGTTFITWIPLAAASIGIVGSVMGCAILIKGSRAALKRVTVPAR